MCSLICAAPATGKCFIEEVAIETLVVLTYRIPADGNMGNFKLTVSVKDTNGLVATTQDLEQEGKVTFTSHTAGEHTVCFFAQRLHHTSYHGPNNKAKIQFRIDVGDQAVDYSQVAKSEHLSAIQVEGMDGVMRQSILNDVRAVVIC